MVNDDEDKGFTVTVYRYAPMLLSISNVEHLNFADLKH